MIDIFRALKSDWAKEFFNRAKSDIKTQQQLTDYMLGKTKSIIVDGKQYVVRVMPPG